MQCDSLFHSNYRVWNRIWAQRKRTTHIKCPQHTLRVLGNRMPNFHRTRDVFQPFSQCFSLILQSFLFVLFLTHFNDFLQYFDDGRIPQASCQHETWVRLVARRPIRWLRSIRNVQIWNLNFEIGNFWKNATEKTSVRILEVDQLNGGILIQRDGFGISKRLTTCS